jgi:hypothetical protein
LEKSGTSAAGAVFSASFATAASFFPKDFSDLGVFAGMDATGVTATDDAATSAGARPGVTPAARADAAAARPAAFFESDADLPALRVVGPRDDGSAAVSRAVDAGVFAFARAAEGSSFFATEAGEMRSISMTSASGFPRRDARDTEAGLVFSLPSLA